MKDGYIPKDKRKKILLLCDDIRMHSGIATMAREFVIGLSHKYNWAQIAGSVTHPEKGKIVDLSQATAAETGVPDPYIRLYPIDGYGNPDILMQVMQLEKPDAILHFTDPRFWVWLYQIEREIRQHCPIAYLNIWDDVPYPMYNRSFYDSCDLLLAISKQTLNINKWVLGPDNCQTVDGKSFDKDGNVSNVVVHDSRARVKNIIHYCPHGINPTTFHPVTTDEEKKKVDEMGKKLFKGKKHEFVMFYNNRNIRRKQTSTILLAWKTFCDNLTDKERSRVALLLHTSPADENGTDLLACKEAFGIDNVYFSADKLSPQDMNILYNLVDVTINLSDNEGFGLGTAESLMSGTPIIVSVTGGLQDQCGFTDENGNPQSFTQNWGSNHNGKITKYGKWVAPIFPGARMVQGSIPTPYILADYARWEDAAEAIMSWFLMSREERKRRGMLGREYCLGEGHLNADYMCQTMSEGLEAMFSIWKGRERFNLHRHDEYIGHKMPGGCLGFEIPRINRDEVIKKFN